MVDPKRPAEDWTYARAGVDVRAKDDAAKRLAKALTFARTGRGSPLGGIGHFAGLIEFGDDALVLCTDGVGTKLEVATALRKWDTVGIDCIAMNVNDCICVGAEPLAFVDYLAVESADPAMAEEIGRGLSAGAEEANVSIVGGETAVLPSIVKGFDLAGTCLGVVRRDAIIGGDAIRQGDTIIGVASSGIHSNGLTLARNVFASAGMGYDADIGDGTTVGAALLEPTRIYVRAIMRLLADLREASAGTEAGAPPIHGIAHITGSGLLNLPRLKGGLRYRIEKPLAAPRIFAAIAEAGNVKAAEMFRTFNMGMGLALVVESSDADAIVKTLSKFHPTHIVGRVEGGPTGVDVPSSGVSLEGAKF
ncbi:MAG: phosphoribosylformylglycinamidine cyclo-ligase [Thermoplasmatota archaeon]